jgi:hypothetical protein
MISVDAVKRASSLVKRIEDAQKLAESYRRASMIIAGTAPPFGGACPLDNKVVMEPAEIGDSIVSALEKRVVQLQEQLRNLGVG